MARKQFWNAGVKTSKNLCPKSKRNTGGGDKINFGSKLNACNKTWRSVSRKSKISKFVALQVSIIPSLSFQVHSPKKKKINVIDIIEAV